MIFLNSYWIDSCPNTINSISLDKDVKTDVCIIGGGIFGLSTAYYLCKNNVNVVVLDKDNIGYKKSGHTTAKITSILLKTILKQMKRLLLI